MQFNLRRWKRVLNIAWPLIISNSLWNLQMTIDRIYLGHYSTEALGAAMAVLGVFWIPMTLLQQTALYVTTFVAQYKGAKGESKIGACLWQSIYVCVIGGVAFLFLNFGSKWCFSLIGHSPAVQALEVEYFNSMSYSALPTALVAAISGFFTGLGETKKVVGLNFIGLAFNAVIAYVMIFGKFGMPRLGVAGAGYATAIATYLAAAYGFYLVLNKKNDERFGVLSDWKLKGSLLRKFLTYGFPNGTQGALEGLSFTVILILIGQMKNGEAALAASSIVLTVTTLSVLPTTGVAQAVMTLVGQRLGEKKPDRAAVATWDGVRISLIFMTTLALTFVLFPGFYLSWFRNDSNPKLWGEVSALVPVLLRLIGIYTILNSISVNVSFALKGAGDTRFVSIVALTVPWPVQVLPTYLARDWDNAAVWAWGFAAMYSVVITGIMLWRFRQGKWRKMSVIGRHEAA